MFPRKERVSLWGVPKWEPQSPYAIILAIAMWTGIFLAASLTFFEISQESFGSRQTVLWNCGIGGAAFGAAHGLWRIPLFLSHILMGATLVTTAFLSMA